MKYKFSIFLFVQILSVQLLSAQFFTPSFYRDTEIDSTLANSISFGIENSNFFKNDEYFNDVIEGYTLTGWFINPKLIYYPSKDMKIELGAHLLKYSGIDSFTRVLPTLSFQYKISKSVDVVIGSLYGSTNHNIVEPVFKYEYYFTDNIENGLQFLFKKPKYNGEVWINWQEFIFTGEDKQEIFTMGTTHNFLLSKPDSKHQFSIPLQVLFVHRGGQINQSDAMSITHNNDAVGLSYKYNFSGNKLNSAGIDQYFVMYNDLSTDYLFQYIQGYGVYTNLYARSKNIQLNASWWYGNHYISLRGHPIYQSMSTHKKDYYEKERALLTGRLMYEKEIIKGLNLGAGAEVYFDLYNYIPDYWYMFYINFNRDFFIKKFKN